MTGGGDHDRAEPETVRRDLTELLTRDPRAGASAVFDLLAGEPRVKPTRGLVIDPHDDVRRRWDCRVAAAAALVESPYAQRVLPELLDELGADPDLAADVLACVDPHPTVAAELTSVRTDPAGS